MLTDGILRADAGLEVEVKDPPKGMIPPGTQMIKPKAEPQPSKVSFQLSMKTTTNAGILFLFFFFFKLMTLIKYVFLDFHCL